MSRINCSVVLSCSKQQVLSGLFGIRSALSVLGLILHHENARAQDLEAIAPQDIVDRVIQCCIKTVWNAQPGFRTNG